MSLSVGQSVSQWISRSPLEAVRESLRQGQTMNLWAGQSINQSVRQWVNQSVSQCESERVSQSSNWSVPQALKLFTAVMSSPCANVASMYDFCYANTNLVMLVHLNVDIFSWRETESTRWSEGNKFAAWNLKGRVQILTMFMSVQGEPCPMFSRPVWPCSTELKFRLMAFLWRWQGTNLARTNLAHLHKLNTVNVNLVTRIHSNHAICSAGAICSEETSMTLLTLESAWMQHKSKCRSRNATSQMIVNNAACTINHFKNTKWYFTLEFIARCNKRNQHTLLTTCAVFKTESHQTDMSPLPSKMTYNKHNHTSMHKLQ